MYIRTDDNGNVVELIKIGGIPEENGYELDTINDDILKDILSYKYIDGEFIKNEDRDILQENIEYIKELKINFLSSACHNMIENGIDVNGSHYSLTSNDQIEMIKLESMIKMNPDTPVFYHADGEKCRMFSAEEFLVISTTALGWITYHRTYFNLMKSEIIDMTNAHDIIHINYGAPLNQTNLDILHAVMNGSTIPSIPTIVDDIDYESLFKPNNNILGDIMLTNNTLSQGDSEVNNEVIINEEAGEQISNDN